MRDTIALQQRALEEIAHRPWPLPEGSWFQAQTWCDLLFAHWRVPADSSGASYRPRSRSISRRWECMAGNHAVVVKGLRPRGTPPLPWVSHFPELNVRTYVELDGKPGIYFSASTPDAERP